MLTYGPALIVLKDINIWLPQNDLASVESFLDIDDTLIGRAPEKEVWVTETLDKGTIDEYVEQFQKFALCPCNQRLKGKARVAPDILVRTTVDGLCQIRKAVALIHGVATRKGDVGVWIGLDDLHQLLRRHLTAALGIPRLGIMAARTLVTAACTINGGPETRTVHHSIFYDIENTNQFNV